MTSDSQTPAGGAHFAGLFLIAMATLMLEILLTRIFSVTMWYHLAFVAVSIAMFGMSLGAIVVYLVPRWFTPGRAWIGLALCSALFAVTAVESVAIHMRSAIDPNAVTSALRDLSRAYGLITLPFLFSGIAVSIALTRFPAQVSRLYAADLAGAAVGCVVLIAVLDRVGGPWTIAVVAAIGFAAALCFTAGSWHRAGRRPRLLMTAAIVVSAAGVAVQMGSRNGRLEIKYAKGELWPKPLYEKWNSYSRVAITADKWELPFGWGLSFKYEPSYPVRQLHLNIDASAETVLTEFSGVYDYLAHLKYDITNMALHLRPNGSVYVIGAGGGRDVLSALAFGQRRVVAVEMNRAILEAVNGVFGDVTGHLDRDPRVRFVNDEARSYLARTDDRFDVIQISLIDTWAATAAGAFVLSENTLYTIGAWKTFLSRLTDRGVISISRWYRRDQPHEVYRATVLAASALRDSGIADPRRHLMVVVVLDKREGAENTPGVATVITSRTPFTDADIDTLEATAKRLDFDVLLSPRAAMVPAFADIADAGRLDAFVAEAPVDLSAPTDDRPFFFKMDSGLLRNLLMFVLLLTVAFLVVPVLIAADARAVIRDPALSLTFVAIGLGFMLVEIAQMLRLTFLLGHPTFSLSVALFGMLLSSGLGSYATSTLDPIRMTRRLHQRLAALVIVLAVLGLATWPLIDAGHTAPTPVRVALALLLLVPAGFFMGMMFPLAMKLATVRRASLGPWLWGINGAASVCASVLAVVIATEYGISAAWWSGVVCYVVAAGLLAWESGRTSSSEGTI